MPEVDVDRIARELFAMGCGAFVGRETCGTRLGPIHWMMTGRSVLRWQTAHGAWLGPEPHPDTEYLVPLCGWHGPTKEQPKQVDWLFVHGSGAKPDMAQSGIREAQARLLQDMDALLMAQQMRAYAEWLHEWGYTLALGTPPTRNLLNHNSGNGGGSGSPSSYTSGVAAIGTPQSNAP